MDGIGAVSGGGGAAAVAPAASSAWNQRGTWFDSKQVMHAPGATVDHGKNEVRFDKDHDFRVELGGPGDAGKQGFSPLPQAPPSTQGVVRVEEPQPTFATAPEGASAADPAAAANSMLIQQIASTYAQYRPHGS